MHVRTTAKYQQSLIAEYEKNYGPLRNFGGSFFEDPKKWVNQCWPWENEKKED